LRGLQCHKSLYLNRYQRDLRDAISPEQQAIFATGREVGVLAQGLFPGGVQSKPPNSFQFQRAVEITGELIAAGKDVIYEAAFQHEQVLALVDILVRAGDEWRAYEVKSSTSVKDVHLPDAAIQYYIMQGQGIELADVSIVHLNTDYVRHGQLDLGQLFIVVSVHSEVNALQAEIPDLVADLKGVLDSGIVPDIPIGPQCNDPYPCDFISHCWSGPSIRSLTLPDCPKRRPSSFIETGLYTLKIFQGIFHWGRRLQIRSAATRVGSRGLQMSPFIPFWRR
jgi:hypothetical protein